MLAALACISTSGTCMAASASLLRVSSPYNGPLPYIVFGVIIALMIYVGYRYIHDNAR